MQHVGPKEQSIRDLPPRPIAKHHQMMIEDGCPPELVRTDAAQPKISKQKTADQGVTLAAPLAVQKAIAAEATPTPEQQESEIMGSVKSKSKSAGKKSAAAKTRTPVRAKSNGANGTDGAITLRPGSKIEIVANLLKRPEGCTTAEILSATNWPSVSVPAMAKSAGLTLKKEKDGKISRYHAA